MSEHVISFEHVSKIYREGFWQRKATAVQDLSFQVPRGKIFGFLGANGAGKTTSIKMLIGLQTSTTGKITALGASPSQFQVRAKIGYLPERPYFQENLTANEFLDFHRSLFGKYLTKEKRPSNEELLALVGLSGVEGRLLRGFSKGMLQRIGIAQTLLNNPELIILDEPMSGLDPVGRKEIRALIGKLHSQGRTVFFSTHILSDVEEVCDEIAFLEKGRLKYSGPVAPLLEDKTQAFDLIFTLPEASTLPLILASAKKIPSSQFKLTVKSENEGRIMMESIWAHNGSIVGFSRVTRSLEEALFGNVR